MSKRIRLTARLNKAADGSIPYPGNVNQPDRTDPAHDKYDNYVETVNHPFPDMRHDWQNDSRDEIGFGIPEAWGTNPTTASVRVAANKAVKLAYLLLGEKVAESVIEDQARDFMMLGPGAIDRSLGRFAKTQSLYAGDEEGEDEGEEEGGKGKKAGEVPEAFKKNWDKGGDKKEEKPAEKKEEGKKAADEEAEKPAEKEEGKKAAEDKKDAPPAFIQKKIDESKEKKDDGKKASAELADKAQAETKTPTEGAKKAAEDEEDEKPAEGKKAAEENKAAEGKKAATKTAEDDGDEDDDAEEPAEGKKASKSDKKATSDFDIELSSSMADVTGSEDGDDGRIAGLFDDGIPAELPEPGAGRKASASSKKEGVRHLGGQPRVASEGAGANDISSIWDAPPDVSDLFR